jgi:hypothetical protein
MKLNTFSSKDTFTKMVNSYFHQNAISNFDEYKNPEFLYNNKTFLIRPPPNVNIDFDYIRNIIETQHPIGVIETCNKNTTIDYGGNFQHLFVVRFSIIYLDSELVNKLYESLQTYGYSDILICFDPTYNITLRLFCDARIDGKITKFQSPDYLSNKFHSHVHTFNVYTMINEKFTIYKPQIQIETDKMYEKIKSIEEMQATQIGSNSSNKEDTRINELEKIILDLKSGLKASNERISKNEEELKWWRKGLYNQIATLKSDFNIIVEDKIIDVEKKMENLLKESLNNFNNDNNDKDNDKDKTRGRRRDDSRCRQRDDSRCRQRDDSRTRSRPRENSRTRIRKNRR